MANGNLKGKSLSSLIKEYKGNLVGRKVYNQFGDNFPLLFKFIDANDNLSIQLHPNDKLARERHDSFGKTEMWYVLESEDNSSLYAGFNRELTRETYQTYFEKGRILNVIHIEKVSKGDAFFIDAGTIHAIGKGVLVAEIQQTSDITYRLYDWDRLDAEGKGRELHTDLAIEALDFTKRGSCKLEYDNNVNSPNEIYNCKYFTTNKLNIFKNTERNIKEVDSFIVYMCVEGKGVVIIEGKEEKIEKGETVLIPALAQNITIFSEEGVELLEVYI